MPTHVVTVLGARPQFIKAAVVSRHLQNRADIVETLVHTGQHFDPNMSGIFFAELGIPAPAHHLEISGGPHGEQTGRMLESVERVLLSERPDLVLVYGDTNSTLAGALAAAKLHIPVAHVEAGLRSHNRRMPEEINRILTDHVASLLFAPTTLAEANLAGEGISAERVHVVGDVMYDAAIHFARRAEATSTVLESLRLEPDRYVLATVHRAENTDDRRRLGAILEALASIAQQIPVVLPLHPRTRRILADGALRAAASTLRLTEPLGYLDMLMLERHARLIATDSGGVQKEAFFQGVPCVTFRDETEWVELVDAGWNRLAPPIDTHSVKSVLEDSLATAPPPARNIQKLYGGGEASARVAAVLAQAAALGDRVPVP